jgi:peptide/nickel transport system substrate-binding protein
VNDPNINSLLEQGRVTLERAERMRLYKDLQRDLVKDVYVVPLYLRPNVVLVNPHIGNYQDNPTDAGNLWNVGDWFLTQ